MLRKRTVLVQCAEHRHELLRASKSILSTGAAIIMPEQLSCSDTGIRAATFPVQQVPTIFPVVEWISSRAETLLRGDLVLDVQVGEQLRQIHVCDSPRHQSPQVRLKPESRVWN